MNGNSSSPKISERQAIKLAEEFLHKRGGVLKAEGAAFMSARAKPELYDHDHWSVFFDLDNPTLRASSLDHVIIDVDAQTGEVSQVHPYAEPNK